MGIETKLNGDNPNANIGCPAIILLGFFVLLLVWLPTTSPMRTLSAPMVAVPSETPTASPTHTPPPPQPSATPSLVPPTATYTSLPPTQTSVPPTSAPESAPAAAAADSASLVTAYDTALVEQGGTLFATCAACHGPDARGLPNLGKDLVTSEFVGGLSDDDLLTFVKTGRPMWDPANTTGLYRPPNGGNPALTDEQLLSIIAYIRSLRQQ
jgi:disulfide bond formation protein DsbB